MANCLRTLSTYMGTVNIMNFICRFGGERDRRDAPLTLTMTLNDLDPLDPEYVNGVLSRHPFVPLPGVINVRDLGLYTSTTIPNHTTRQRFVLRSAELSGITEQGAFSASSLFRPLPQSSDIQEKKPCAPWESLKCSTCAPTRKSKNTIHPFRPSMVSMWYERPSFRRRITAPR